MGEVIDLSAYRRRRGGPAAQVKTEAVQQGSPPAMADREPCGSDLSNTEGLEKTPQYRGLPAPEPLKSLAKLDPLPLQPDTDPDLDPSDEGPTSA